MSPFKQKYNVFAIHYTMDNGCCTLSRRNFVADTIANSAEEAEKIVAKRMHIRQGVQMEYAGDKADYLWLRAELVQTNTI